MNGQTEAEKVRAALRRTNVTREYARVVAVNMVRINGFAVQVVANALSVNRGTIHNG